MIKMLTEAGFRIVFEPQGSFFIFAELPSNYPMCDVRILQSSICSLFSPTSAQPLPLGHIIY